MKKYLPVVVILLIIGIVAYGFLKEDDSTSTEINPQLREELESNSVYPVYDSLNTKEKQAYIAICNAMENYTTSEFVVGEYDSKAECERVSDQLEEIYRVLVYEQPDYFWVNLNKYDFSMWEIEGKYQLRMKLSYIMEKETAMAQKEVFDKKVEEIAANAESKTGTFQKVLYVYDYILENTEYDYVLEQSEDSTDVGRSAYGCLIEGETVCSGYSLAFNLIMQQLGIESGVEFNTYNEISAFDGHVWNYCNLDGEYYYFDLTWDDSGFDSEEYKPYIDYSHCYFAITKEELSESRFLAAEATTPACNGTQYNYFTYNNMNISQYDFETVKNAILAQPDKGQYVALRFDSYSELLKAESELMTEGQIYTILPDKENIRYVISNSSLHLYIFYDN